MKGSFFELNQNVAAINGLQQYFLCEWISAIYHFEFGEKGIDPRDTINAFQAMLPGEISDTVKQLFVSKGLWESIEKVRDIFSHPNPQQKLDLIKYNDISSPAITREGVVCHLKQLIEEKISLIASRQLGHSSGL